MPERVLGVLREAGPEEVRPRQTPFFLEPEAVVVRLGLEERPPRLRVELLVLRERQEVRLTTGLAGMVGRRDSLPRLERVAEAEAAMPRRTEGPEPPATSSSSGSREKRPSTEDESPSAASRHGRELSRTNRRVECS